MELRLRPPRHRGLSPTDEIRQLFTLPPSEFVAARDRLANELRSAGDRDRAEEVARLRRPTVVAWGLNQLAHRHADLVGRLRLQARDVQAAHEGAVAGERTDLAAADDRLRATIRDLAGRAAAIVVEDDVAASGHRDDMEQALWSVVVDRDIADRLEEGTLQSTPEAAPGGFGFGVVEATEDDGAPGRDERTARATLRRLEERMDRARRQVERRQERVQRLEDRLAAERRQLRAVEDDLSRVEEERDRVQAALDRTSGSDG